MKRTHVLPLEIQAGLLAKDRARSGAVRIDGEMLVTDHQKTKEALDSAGKL